MSSLLLQLVVTDYLYDRYPGESEAFLTQLRQHVVSGVVLADLSGAVGLPRWALLSAPSEAARARERVCVAEDIFEAFLAAIFKVHGFEAAKKWLVGVMHEHLDLPALIYTLRCSKDRLVRFCADRYGFRPRIATEKRGDAHCCAVHDADGAVVAECTAETARQAELDACQLAWERIVAVKA